MARSRRFVPNFDLLGLRITPSDASLTAFPSDLIPDESELPGTPSSIEDTITWEQEEDSRDQSQDRTESYLATVDWMLPMQSTPTPN